jgi:hypothetical protein
MRNYLLNLILIFFCPGIIAAQTTQQLNAVRSTMPVKIDGIINEEAWKQAQLISGLIEMRPSFGKVEDTRNKTEVYLLYDNDAVYFGGTLYEANKDSISTQLAGRDGIGINDFIGVIFDTYQDKINGLGFYVTPLNEQFDLKYSIGMNGGEDIGWSAVYSTATQIHDNGWSFEMRIPYSALRFSKQNKQNWNMQIIRRRAKTGQQFSWSPVDPTKFGFMNQAGTWLGLQDIKPPLRLSFSPYFSSYLTKNPNDGNTWKTSVNGGMDVKYGITDGFTMDMTLIPDFGQVQSDNQVLNLSPFEIRFDEKRPFFTEGIELFNKGNLFYSRRIGLEPVYFESFGLNPGDSILKFPVEAKIVNATKISGRTKKKLGIGFLNAITKAQHATIQDALGNKYAVPNLPATNYNILVLDQGLKNNSRVTLINTNVWRSGAAYDANVTALDWDLYDNKVDWNVWGQVNHSRLIGYEEKGKTKSGYLYNLFGGKFKGRFNFEVHRFFADEKYQQGDLGYFTNNNYVTHGFYAGYKWVKPKKFYNNIYLNLNGNYSERYTNPHDYQYARLNGNMNGQMKNLWFIGINADLRAEDHDFYEPRLAGWMVKRPGSWMKGFWVNTNRAKKYSASFELYHRRSSKFKGNYLQPIVSNSYRFSDKLNARLFHYFEFYNRDFGFAYFTNDRDSIAMGLRNRRTAENTLDVKYNFNNMMGLTFRVRHYWSRVDFKEFFNLERDGSVTPLAAPVKNPDRNVNVFNIDMNYTWQFAPGSFINLNWKTATDLENKIIDENYFKNFTRTVETPQLNSFSVKVIYYLDYLDIKKWGKKK